MAPNPQVAAYGIPAVALAVVPLIFIAITAILVGLRLHVRTFVTQALGWDDALLVGAQVLYCSSDLRHEITHELTDPVLWLLRDMHRRRLCAVQ